MIFKFFSVCHSKMKETVRVCAGYAEKASYTAREDLNQQGPPSCDPGVGMWNDQILIHVFSVRVRVTGVPVLKTKPLISSSPNTERCEQHKQLARLVLKTSLAKRMWHLCRAMVVYGTSKLNLKILGNCHCFHSAASWQAGDSLSDRLTTILTEPCFMMITLLLSSILGYIYKYWKMQASSVHFVNWSVHMHYNCRIVLGILMAYFSALLSDNTPLRVSRPCWGDGRSLWRRNWPWRVRARAREAAACAVTSPRLVFFSSSRAAPVAASRRSL